MEKHFYGFIIRVQALILKKNNLRKNLIHEGHRFPLKTWNSKHGKRNLSMFTHFPKDRKNLVSQDFLFSKL